MKGLTEEQKILLEIWYNIYVNEKWKLVIEETEESKTNEAYAKFNKATAPFKELYTEDEQKIFFRELFEAHQFKNSGFSTWINKCTIKGESSEQLADKIIEKAELFEDVRTKAKRELRQSLKDLKLTK